MVWMELCRVSGTFWAVEKGTGVGLRWCHVALLNDELADLEGDAAVVHGLGDQSCDLLVQCSRRCMSQPMLQSPVHVLWCW
jgi:hypothetical protein